MQLAPIQKNMAMISTALRRLLSLYQNFLATDYDDHFILRLRQVNTGMYRKGNIGAIKRAIELMPAGGAVLEIGSFTGLSTNVISYLLQMQKRDTTIFCCDPWEATYREPLEQRLGASTLTSAEWMEFVLQTFRNNVTFFARNLLPYAIRMTSAEFAQQWHNGADVTDVFGRQIRLGGSFAFCFVDGRHEYEFVQKDFFFCDQYLLQSGLILMDDSADYTGSTGVRHFVKELNRSRVLGRRYEIVQKAPNYLVRKLS